MIAAKIVAGKAVLGLVVAYPGGFRFIPHTDAHKRSRRLWPTPEAAIPKWAKKARAAALATGTP